MPINIHFQPDELGSIHRYQPVLSGEISALVEFEDPIYLPYCLHGDIGGAVYAISRDEVKIVGSKIVLPNVSELENLLDEQIVYGGNYERRVIHIVYGMGDLVMQHSTDYLNLN